MTKEKLSTSSSPTAAAAVVVAGSGGTDDKNMNTTTPATAMSEMLRAMTIKTTIETSTGTTTTSTTTPNSTPATTTTATGNDTTTATSATSTAASTALKKNVAMIPRSETIPKTISRSYNIYQIPTHTFCQIYADRLVIGVTQLTHNQGHIGSWVLCTANQSPTNPTQTEYELSTVLGNSVLSTVGEHEKEIYARRITERLIEKAIIIPKGTDKLVVLLGISLLPIPTTTTTNNDDDNNNDAITSFTSIERFKTLVEVLVELIEETAQL